MKSKIRHPKSEIENPKSATLPVDKSAIRHTAGGQVRNPQSNETILEDRARALARKPAEEFEEGEFFQILSFASGQERFGLDVTLVQDVQPLGRQNWARVPCTPDFIIGAVNIRGRIYSMTHIGRFLGLEAAPISDMAHIILVEGGEIGGEEQMELCILADDIPKLEKISPKEVQSSSGMVSAGIQEYVRGVTDDMLTILNMEKLLSDPRMIISEDM